MLELSIPPPREQEKKMRRTACLLVLGLLLIATSQLQADRTPTARTSGSRNTGARNDITVPYTTDGTSTFMKGGSVAPRIYASPVVDDPKHPQSKPVFNLIFYGAKQGFGDKSNGATPRTR
jgi:hypothetical protein